MVEQEIRCQSPVINHPNIETVKTWISVHDLSVNNMFEVYKRYVGLSCLKYLHLTTYISMHGRYLNSIIVYGFTVWCFTGLSNVNEMRYKLQESNTSRIDDGFILL